MVVDMAGRTNRAKRPPVASDAIVVLDLCCRLKSQVLMPVIRRHPTNQRGACCLGEARRRWGVIRVGMGAGDKFQLITHAIENGLNVRGRSGAGIHHHQIGFTYNIGIGAGTGHGSRIRRHDAAHPRRQ